MRSYPEADYEIKNAASMNAPNWMLELLRANPEYTCWGPYEDYMGVKGRDEGGTGGWNARMLIDSWAEHTINVDDLNEVVNFYFEITRPNEECSCGGKGVNVETSKLADTWYGEGLNDGWHNKLTQVEVDALAHEGRLSTIVKGGYVDGKFVPDPSTIPTAKHINDSDYMHDAINRWICVEARARSMGVYGICGHCDGEGYYYTSPNCNLGLVYWLLHPRKGCSRGVHVKDIQREQLPEVFAFLRAAAERNAQRFAHVVGLAEALPIPVEKAS